MNLEATLSIIAIVSFLGIWGIGLIFVKLGKLKL